MQTTETEETIEEFTEQVQRGACSKEVFAEDEIPFDVALEVVKRRMTDGMMQIRAKGHGYAWLSLSGVIWPGEQARVEFDFHASGDGDSRSTSTRLETALDGMPKVMSAAEKREKRKAELRAELANLEAQ